MSRVIEKTVYHFDELTDTAKEKARDWWRRCEMEEGGGELLEANKEDFTTCAEILGIEFDTRPVKLRNNTTRYDPKIYYSGFSSQGDGASFEGRYSYAKGAPKKIREHAPKDTKLHRIADELQAIQRKHFYRIVADMGQGPGSNFYSHSGTMSVDVTINGETVEYNNTQQTIKQLMRDFADWMYSQLEKEYEYRMSNENIDESIRCNEYEFDESGEVS